MPKFTLQIVEEDGTVAASWLPGEKAEQDLATAIVESAIGKGLGVFVTEAQARVKLNAAVHEVLYGLKSRVRVEQP